MRKVMVIASREYKAAVKTKAFLIGLLMMPLLMGGSILVQMLLKDVRDIKDKKFAIVDRTEKSKLTKVVEAAVFAHNSSKAVKEKKASRWVLEEVTPEKDVEAQRLKLSDRVRSGELIGFLEIGSDVPLPFQKLDRKYIEKEQKRPERQVRYQTNRPTFQDFELTVQGTLSATVQVSRIQQVVKNDLKRTKKISDYEPPFQDLVQVAIPLDIKTRGLTKKQQDGSIGDTGGIGRAAPFFVPFGCVMLMFMMIMMTTTPMMQGVVEEKMQRIAEVLLGSVSPFQLMLGKLLGMTAVSLSVAAVYLGGALWAAEHYGFREYLPWDLIIWFVIFQALAAMMFGSLFIAIGAACTEMKETQNLMWPVMLVAMFPIFLLQQIITEPNGSVATAMSFFPFATPTLMIARMGIPPGIPPWQPWVGVSLVLATTVLCVFVAGRIFRVGILMQGKGAKLSEMAKWVLRG